MSADLSTQELLEVQAHFNLPSPVLVEKDYYLVKALAAIKLIAAKPCNLVLGGRTSLCRAHQLIQRMSEDIDLKIVGEREPTGSELRQLRARITDALIAASFDFDPGNRAHRDSRNEGRHTIFHLPYAHLLLGAGSELENF